MRSRRGTVVPLLLLLAAASAAGLGPGSLPPAARSADRRDGLVAGAGGDEATVYASPDGNDAADGSRAAPVRSLFRALDLAARSGRLVVRLAVGEYSVDAGLKLTQGMTLLGGLESGTWSPAGPAVRSRIVPSPRFRGQGALLSAAAGAVTIAGVEFADGPGTPAALLSLAGTALAARDVSFVVSSAATGTGLSAVGSTVTISDSSFAAEGDTGRSLVSVAGGMMTITGCTLHGPADAADFACIDVTAGARVALAGSDVDPGSGTRVRGIRAVDSTVGLEGSRLASGAGRVDAAAVDVRGGTMIATACGFSASPEATVPACLIGDGAAITVEECRLEVSGQSGAAGIAVTGGSVSVRGSQLLAGTTAEYLYLVHAIRAELTMEETLLSGGDTGDLIDVVARDSRVELRSVTIAAGRGRLAVTGIDAQGVAALRVSATVIAAPSGAVGPAIIVRQPGRGLPEGVEILSSCFGGWDWLIGFDPSSGIRDVPDVDGLNDLDGDPYGGSFDGCIAEDPQFTFRGEGDYRLSESSVCLGAGIGAHLPE